MYDYFKGILTYKSNDSKEFLLTLEVGGIGYSFELCQRDFELLPFENEELKLFSVLVHKEDKMSLCGFLKREDRDIYNVLTSVSGVGSKMALTLLNSFSVGELVGFVLDGNYKELTKAKGVGPKLAQKIILELKGKLNSYSGSEVSTSPRVEASKVEESQNVRDARSVLLSLGYEKNEVAQVMEQISPDASEAAEDILKKALKRLSL